jgi:hypothetical protein
MDMQTIEKEVYIGPERRSADRRTGTHWPYGQATDLPERRSGEDRRQDALAGIIAGLGAEDMLALRELWELAEL